MYLAISKLKIASNKETEFETAWKNREQNTHGVKGFKKLDLFKGIETDEFSLYIFYSEWNSESDFISQTKSNLFKSAHKNPTSQKSLYLGPPDFDGYVGLPDFEGYKLVT